MKLFKSISWLCLLVFSTATWAADCAMTTDGETALKPRIDVYYAIIEQWKAKSIDGVLDNLTDDVVWHTATSIDPPLLGKEAARAWLEKYGGSINNSRWRVVSYVETPTRLFVEGIEDYELPDGTRIAFPYAGAYDFRGDKICGWRDYFDRGLTVRLKNGEPAAQYLQELNARPEIAR